MFDKYTIYIYIYIIVEAVINVFFPEVIAFQIHHI